MARVPVTKTLGSDKIHLYVLLATKLRKKLLEELKDPKNWHKCCSELHSRLNLGRDTYHGIILY